MTTSKYILPAEWHRQACVQLTWPHEATDWSPYLDDITETFIQIAKAVAQYESLVVAAKYPERVREQLEDSLSDEEMSRVSIYECDNNDTWARDHAFLTLVPAIVSICPSVSSPMSCPWSNHTILRAQRRSLSTCSTSS